jgi:short-subunit dehydrogenase
VDSERFGPWALITGASSGIGREFARQIAASHINVVLVARRQALLDALGTELNDCLLKREIVRELQSPAFFSSSQ